MSLLAALNPPQREAAKYLDGPLLVLAGAGSGKTRVITHKIAYLIGECGYKPSSIAAITFTNKAAREMAERAAKLTQSVNTKGLIVTTFHSMGLRMLREDAKFAELKPAFSILDSADAMGIISEIIKTTDKQEIRRAVSRISLWKNELKSPATALATAEDDNARSSTPRSTTATMPPCAPIKRVDFDDLFRLPAELLDTHAELREKWQNRLRHILVAQLVVAGGDTLLSVPQADNNDLRLEDDSMLFFLLPNTGGAVRPGTQVSVKFGGVELEPLPAQ